MRRALCPRRVGRWPRLRLWSRSLRHCRAGGGGTAPQPWQGPSPLPRGTLPPGQPGAKAPGQRPTRPKAGASRPPGRALAFVGAGGDGPGGTVAQGAGETQCVSCSRPRRGGERSHLGTSSAVLLAGAIAPATSSRWHQDQPGAKAPGQRPPRPKAGASHPPGWALAFVALGGMVLWWASCRGGGNAVRFPFPPTEGPEDLTGTQGPRSKTVRADLTHPCPQKTAPPNPATQGWSSWGAEGRGRAAGGTHPSPPRRHGRSARH